MKQCGMTFLREYAQEGAERLCESERWRRGWSARGEETERDTCRVRKAEDETP